MPTRLIRDGINTSEKINKLSMPAEIFYRRLLNEVDDYGRFSAHPCLLIAACYPLKLDSIKVSDIEQWLKELIDVRGSEEDKSGLLICYEQKGKKYLQILNFRQKIRSKSKYPPPVLESICTTDDTQMRDNDNSSESACIADDMQMRTNGSTNDLLGEGEGEGVGENTSASNSIHTDFCKRNGKKVEAVRHGKNVLLTAREYERMVDDWGESFAKDAITEYDQRYPNSQAIRKHTDHNLGIRDYVRRGYICEGKKPSLKNGGFPDSVLLKYPPPTPEEIGTREERSNILRETMPSNIRNGKGIQPIGDILKNMNLEE